MNSAFETQGVPMALAGAPAQGAASAGLGNRPGRNRKRRVPRRSRRGISIFPVILGVAIAALVTVGLVSAYQTTTTNTRTQAVLTTLATIESAIRRSHASLPQYEAQLTAGLLSVVPSNAVTGGHAAMPGTSTDTRRVVTPWGGFIYAGGGATVDNDGTGAASPNRFYVVVLGLPEQACETIAKSFLGNSGVVSVAAEGTAATAATSAQTTGAAIDAECDGGDDDKVGIVFRG